MITKEINIMLELIKECVKIADGTIPDGFFDDRKPVEFYYHPESQKTICLTDVGYFNSGCPLANDANESLWLLKNHPINKSIRITKNFI